MGGEDIGVGIVEKVGIAELQGDIHGGERSVEMESNESGRRQSVYLHVELQINGFSLSVGRQGGSVDVKEGGRCILIASCSDLGEIY